jgi:hypothetical protein
MITITRSLNCDAPDCGNWVFEDTEQTAAELRREAARYEGWSRRGGKDYCDRCTERAQGDNG